MNYFERTYENFIERKDDAYYNPHRVGFGRFFYRNEIYISIHFYDKHSKTNSLIILEDELAQLYQHYNINGLYELDGDLLGDRPFKSVRGISDEQVEEEMEAKAANFMKGLSDTFINTHGVCFKRLPARGGDSDATECNYGVWLLSRNNYELESLHSETDIVFTSKEFEQMIAALDGIGWVEDNNVECFFYAEDRDSYGKVNFLSQGEDSTQYKGPDCNIDPDPKQGPAKDTDADAQ